MLKKQKMLFTSILAFSAVFGTGLSQSYAWETITISPQSTNIEGSIKYSVIGKYVAHFNNFRGRIVLDERSQEIRSVNLEIDVKSINSNHPWCDRLARSRRLLNAARYPEIIFKSDKIIQDQGGCVVKGVLDMHGIKQRLAFPFKMESVIDQGSRAKLFDMEGHWVINRRDFNIIWNKYLDHGGIIVSDEFMVNWVIRASIK